MRLKKDSLRGFYNTEEFISLCIQIKDVFLAAAEESTIEFLGHRFPDPDTVCSILSMLVMTKENLEISVENLTATCPWGIPKNIEFLMGDKFHTHEASDLVHISLEEDTNLPKKDLFSVSVDVPAMRLLIDSREISIVIDHHKGNNIQAPLSLVETRAASTTELLFYLAVALEWDISVDVANFLYAGLYSDTLSLSKEDMTEETFFAMLMLKSIGADHHGIAVNLKKQARPLADIQLGILKTREFEDGIVSCCCSADLIAWASRKTGQQVNIEEVLSLKIVDSNLDFGAWCSVFLYPSAHPDFFRFSIRVDSDIFSAVEFAKIFDDGSGGRGTSMAGGKIAASDKMKSVCKLMSTRIYEFARNRLVKEYVVV